MAEFICCPLCKGRVQLTNKTLTCINCKRKYQITGGIARMLPGGISGNDAITSWDRYYRETLTSKTYADLYHVYQSDNFTDTFEQLNAEKKIEGINYLEIGSGPFYLGIDIARRCRAVVAIDSCFAALEVAKTILDKQGIRNYILIQGDIRMLPIQSGRIDLIYGGGVIEHLRDCRPCLRELDRVLKTGGVSFNTVPMLNIGSLTYRQLWGNIPNFPILRQLAEFIHITLLRQKHMRFGYELSFTPGKIRQLHAESGFRDIRIGKFRVILILEFLPKWLKPPFRYLCEHSRLFWPMIKIVATK
jgi:ubiquinone/menaquinone biosynthesis C-methylase UbiE/uncharacterized protein YbaR (Trm112 family)